MTSTKTALTALEIEFETSIADPLEVKKFLLDKWEPLRGVTHKDGSGRNVR